MVFAYGAVGVVEFEIPVMVELFATPEQLPPGTFKD
jgi:hypothetical protein